MPTTDLFFKVQIEHDAGDNLEKLSSEIARAIRRVYGVRSVELASSITHSDSEET